MSQWLANEVKQSFLCNYPIRVIHNGVDINVFRPVGDKAKLKYNMENHFLILGVATVWNVRKGLSDFIKLAENLSSDDRVILSDHTIMHPDSLANLGNYNIHVSTYYNLHLYNEHNVLYTTNNHVMSKRQEY